MDLLQTPDFWIGLVKIVWINIILSGDNAVVIALAARSLPEPQQKLAVVWGSGAAVVMRVVLTVVAVRLLALPFLQIGGGALLLWIGVQLLSEDDEDENESQAHAKASLAAAIRTILVADLIMSLDNVIAVAAAAKGDMALLVLGLAISIPLVVFGATLMVKLMERYPLIVIGGAGLIGWVAGETIVSDAILAPYLQGNSWLHYAAAATGAGLVIALGKFIQARSRREQTA